MDKLAAYWKVVHTEKYIASIHINKGGWKSAYVHIGNVGNASISL